MVVLLSEDIDYTDVFSPIVRHTCIRVLISLVAYLSTFNC